jgi:hypothetical protein
MLLINLKFEGRPIRSILFKPFSFLSIILTLLSIKLFEIESSKIIEQLWYGVNYPMVFILLKLISEFFISVLTPSYVNII